uniref:NADH-ubiquinone oxidoreductase chain 2 n=7 Tax=Lepidodactylus TaxID=47722 RepID=J9WJ89_LEPLU|nr:NADH dehydrogenase subunit 2 [Lepidodactylus lugubris]AEO50795.1 NADH dehydrogenase subunit 2 [Lepidodactylus moestus]AFS17330.1 NADH dehydrogenase subunit 2 [Lepidodactylus lugubris]UFQ90563.1 NADH dehydrogenase subunit 2 [Lepidodactylus moestus]BAP90297.1 NADH dehydrogenase subunit 2 [Lepidodactylus lugubris]
MNPMIWSLLVTGLSLGTIITMSSHHWLLAWLGLELNTLSMLPIIMKPTHPRATEAATKYFLIQAIAAALILFSSAMDAWITGQWYISHTPTPMLSTAIILAIVLKLGLAPTHAWYPEVLQGSTLLTALIISTWQKLAPLTLLYMMSNHLSTNTMLLLGTTSALIGGWSGLIQTQTRKIMAFSSIAHMGWLIIAMALSPTLAAVTLAIYIINTAAIFMMLNTTTTKTLTDMGTMWTQSPPLTSLTTLTLMSLGGLPPLTGFMPKWLILNELCSTKLVLLAATLAAASLPSLYFYTRMNYLTTLTTPPNTTNTEHKWRFMNPPNTLQAIAATLATLLLPMTPLFIT